MASEKLCVQIYILKNLGIYLHSDFRKNDQGGGANLNPKKIQVYTFIVASGKNFQGGMQFEILNIIQV